MGVLWYLIIVLTYISLMRSEIEHLFMCLLAMWIYPFMSCLFAYIAWVPIGLSVLFLMTCGFVTILKIHSFQLCVLQLSAT